MLTIFEPFVGFVQSIAHRTKEKRKNKKNRRSGKCMRKLCPNIDKDDGLETVLEVPIPEEMFSGMGNNPALRCQNMMTWMKAQTSDKWSQPLIAARINELRFLLYLVGSPLIPLQVQVGHSVHKPVKDSSIVSNLNLTIDLINTPH